MATLNLAVHRDVHHCNDCWVCQSSFMQQVILQFQCSSNLVI